MNETAENNDSQYQLLFEYSLDGILLTTPDGSILDANPSACRILGRTREEILREGRMGVMDSSDPRLPGMLKERARHGRVHGELNARRKDGSLFPVEVSSVVFHDPDGSVRACTLMRDISARKQGEAERELLIGELQDALARVKLLSGMLSICSSCKKTRNEQGTWEPLEAYIRAHSEAEFSHGLCPECIRKLYPDHSPSGAGA